MKAEDGRDSGDEGRKGEEDGMGCLGRKRGVVREWTSYWCRSTLYGVRGRACEPGQVMLEGVF